MSLPRSVPEVLRLHVALNVEGIHRMYLNVYQPRFQTERGAAAFFRFHPDKNYFYGVDADFGPFLLEFCTYFPYNAKLCINVYKYVKRQPTKEGIAFEDLSNGVLSCADLKRL